MSHEQLKAFLEAVKVNAGLQEKLKAAADVDALVEIARSAGFVISADELKKSQAEVSDEELEVMAGGMATFFQCINLYVKTVAGGGRCEFDTVECPGKAYPAT